MKNNQYHLLLFSNDKHHLFSDSDEVFLKILNMKNIFKINKILLSENKKSVIVSEFDSEANLMQFLFKINPNMRLHVWIAVYFQSNRRMVVSKEFFAYFYQKKYTFEIDIYDQFTTKESVNKKPILEIIAYSNKEVIYKKLSYAYNLGLFLLREVKVISNKFDFDKIDIEISFRSRPATPYIIFNSNMLEIIYRSLDKYLDYSISIYPKN